MQFKLTFEQWRRIGSSTGWLTTAAAAETKPRVLFATLPDMWDLQEGDLKTLRDHAEVDYMAVKSMKEEELAERCSGYDYLMLNMDFLPAYPDKMERLTEKFYNHKGVSGLKGINVDMTDADFFSPELAEEKEILLQTTPDAVSASVAESAVAEILLHAKGRHLAYMDLVDGKDVECRKGMNLEGKTAGILGHGHIGKRVGRALSAMGMKVLFNDIKSEDGFKNTPVDELFKRSDVISIHIPALQKGTNRSNIGLVDAKLLNLCSGAILINLATDIIVDNDALKSAIKSGKIVGYSVEPGRKQTEGLSDVDGVHMSPCSFDSDESRRRVVEIWFENMKSMIDGRPQNLWN